MPDIGFGVPAAGGFGLTTIQSLPPWPLMLVVPPTDVTNTRSSPAPALTTVVPASVERIASMSAPLPWLRSISSKPSYASRPSVDVVNVGTTATDADVRNG